ncbi:unnamed protein product [Meloidogyne enterolobii]|uniref:Uncharacterized protein n=1 Tax=Meloidogyne enterolobii TaxID=390850 RepID=A0ACB0ZDJ9_MELEN
MIASRAADPSLRFCKSKRCFWKRGYGCRSTACSNAAQNVRHSLMSPPNVGRRTLSTLSAFNDDMVVCDGS